MLQCRLAVCALALLTTTAASATDRYSAPGGRSIEMRISETGVYDSNPLRIPGGGEEIFGSTTSPELRVRWKGPRSYVESATRVDQNFFNRSAFNSTDLHQQLLLSRESAHWVADLNGGFDRDTTRTSELTNYANRRARIHRTKYTASPKLTYRNSARDRFSLGSNLTHVTYDSSSFTDYNLFAISTGYTRQLDANHDLGFAINAQRYDALSGASLTSDSIGPALSLTSRHTPRLSTQLSGGALAIRKHGSNTGTDKRNTNYVFQARGEYRGEVDTLSLSASRARTPFGNGTETLLTSFQLSERHALGPRFAATARANYQLADYDAEPGINLDYSWSAGGGLIYSLRDDMDLSADYRFIHEQLTRTADTAQQHVVMLGINYHTDWN